MLRWMVGLLLVANAVYFAWTQGHLTALGFAPHEQSEPERLKAQIKPEALRLLNAPDPAEAPATPATPAAPTQAIEPDPAASAPESNTEEAPVEPEAAIEPPTACWQATGFNEAQATALRRELTRLGLSRNRWTLSESRSGGRWVVYMGRYNDEALQRKKEELRDLKVEFRTLSAPPLGNGLALGTYSSESAAEQGLKDVARKGVRSARVAQERDPSTTHTLRLPAITADEYTVLANMGSTLAGKSLQRCSD